ncbi:MAG TPA: ATP-binding protein [Terriglobia bacterium]|nr:ATP-binding protein [Terriglobia bacterium]
MAKKDCSICQGTGWKPVESNGVRQMSRCECEQTQRSEILLKHAQIPPRYEHCAFENFDIRKDSGTGQPNRSLVAAKLYSQKLVEEYPTDFGLLFIGPTGSGKTHLGVAVLRELMLRKGVSCLYYDFLKLLKDIRDSYNPVSHTSELRVLGPVLEAEVLLLDDLTASDPTDWVRETLAYIISSRYNEKKVTLITTTLASREPSRRRNVRTPAGEAVPDVDRSIGQLGPTLSSRLYEMCKLVEISSDDYRKAIKQAGFRFHIE